MHINLIPFPPPRPNAPEQPRRTHPPAFRSWRPVSTTTLVVLLFAASTSGCFRTTRPGAPTSADTPARHERLTPIENLLAAGHNTAALLACVEVSQQYPDTPGLAPLRQRVLAAVQREQTQWARAEQHSAKTRMTIETMTAAGLPDRYGIERMIQPLPDDHLRPDSPMRAALDKPVSLHLRGANLALLIDALTEDVNINIIADHEIGQDRRINIDVTDLPLRELLQYASRNLDVQFYPGDHAIWVASSEPDKAPLETRIYRLRQGLQMHGDDWGTTAAGTETVTPSDISALTHKATVLSKGKTYIETIIDTMVPEHPGAVTHLNRNLHVLFVRNTRENLDRIDQIVTALDDIPPQVLIEARFIEVMIGDLREIGIEWMLNSPWTLTRKGVMRDGAWVQTPKIQMDDAGIRYTPYESTEGGPHPLGPQGAFGTPGNPATAAQGLSLAVEGILTRPMFEAVLHALEISGQGRTLSMPRVTTMNNNPAKLRSGSDLRYFEEFQAQAFNLVDANNQRYTITVLIPKGAPSIEELGITLVAVPSVGADRRTINLLLNPAISDLEGFVSYQDDSFTARPETEGMIRQVVVKLPVFTRREVATKLTVQSGETVVMGGLIDTVQQETVHSVPILGSIPLLGTFFRRTGTTEQRRNLLIFVTATVISDTGESLVTRIANEDANDTD